MKLKNAQVNLVKNVYTDTISAAVDAVYQQLFGMEATCTSANDGIHMMGSMHPLGRALDIRFKDILHLVAAQISARLPPWYDVVIEEDHFHIEADLTKQPKDV